MADSRIVTGTAVAGLALVAGPQHGVLCEDLTMSSISSIGSGVSQFLQNLISNNASSSNSSNASSGATTSTTPTRHHHHGGGGFEKLAGAVVNALQSAASNSNSSGGAAADPNQTITAALTKILQNGSLGGSGDADSSAGSTSNNATTGATGSTTTSGIPAAFAQTLQSFGVTAQQFQADLTTALQNAQQNGTADLSTAFKSFPAGSLVDALG